MQMNVVKTLTVRGKSEGMAAVKADLDGVAAAQDKVAASSEAMARKTETSARRQLSAGRDYQRLMERNDRMVMLQSQLARETATVNRAFDQGVIDVGRHAAAIELLETKYRGLVSAEERARAAAQGLVVANDNQAASLHRLASANDNARGSVANIAAQFQDVGVTAAMGMNPIMIALQQGTQLSAVLSTMQSPLRGLGAAFISIINPVSLLTIGFIALAAAAIQWFSSAKSEADEAAAALKDHDAWLDKILVGYGDIRDAAKQAGEEAAKLPREALQVELGAKAAADAEAYARALDAIGEKQAELLRWNVQWRQQQADAAKSFPDDIVRQDRYDQLIAFSEELARIRISASSTQQELADFTIRLTAMRQNADAPELRNLIDEMVTLTDAMRLNKEMAARSSTAEMEGNLAALAERAVAAAKAIRASYDASVAASGGYIQAANAALTYSNSLAALQARIPAVAAQQQALAEIEVATNEWKAGVKALDDMAFSAGEAQAKRAELDAALAAAKAEVSGLTGATVDLDQAERNAYVESLPAKEAAIARLNDQHAARVTAINAAVAAGGNAAAAEDQIARSAEVLAQEIANTNAQFDKTAASASGAGKALRDAEKDFASFATTADKLAEALFPAEYARREAAELMALLDQYRDKLDEFQIAGIEREIGNLNSAADQGMRRLEDRAAETGDQVMKTLGSVLGSLFDGPMDDMDAFFDKAMAGFAQIGQQNLAKWFEGSGSSGSGEAGAGGNFLDSLVKGVKAGSKEGTFAGAQGGIMSLSSMGGMASAAIGGLGMGYQTQDPMMGALGGAAQGAMAGIAGGPIGMAIGAVVGGLGGLIGGLMGASKALQEAQQKLEENRMAIQQFIAAANGEQISRYAKTLADFNKQAAELMALAQKAGDQALVDKLRAANDNVVGTLGKEFAKEIEASINRLRGDDFLNQASAALDAYNMRMKDAVMLGVDASGAMTELSLTLRKIIEDGDLTADQLARLTSLFPSLAAELASIVASMPPPGSMTLDDAQSAVDRARQDLRESYEAEATTLREVIDRNRQFIKSLESFKASLRLDQNLSGLSPMERFLEAQSQFESVSAAALAGDADAMAKLEAVSRAYLEEAKGYYASSEQYFEIFGRVESVLDQALANAQGAVSGAEQQLAALEHQVSLLIDIDRSVQSVADAIYALTVAVANLSTVEGGGYVPLPGFASGGSFTVAGASGVDQNVLSINGRAAARVGRGEIVDIRPPASGNDNSSAAVLGELRALREEVAMLRGVTAAGAQAVVRAASGTTEAVQTGNRGASQANLRRPS